MKILLILLLTGNFAFAQITPNYTIYKN